MKQDYQVKIQPSSDSNSLQMSPIYFSPHARQSNSRIYAKTGLWTYQQKLKYVLFIQYHAKKMKDTGQRRLWRVFKIMANFIGTRKANQCRTHHLKMQKYFGQLNNIIDYYRARMLNYEEQLQKSKNELEGLCFGIAMKEDCSEKIKKELDQVKMEVFEEAESPIIYKKTSLRCEQEQCNQQDIGLLKTDSDIKDFPQKTYQKASKNRIYTQQEQTFINQDNWAFQAGSILPPISPFISQTPTNIHHPFLNTPSQAIYQNQLDLYQNRPAPLDFGQDWINFHNYFMERTRNLHTLNGNNFQVKKQEPQK